MQLSRRRFIGTAGIVIAGGIAGCLGEESTEGLTLQSIDVAGSPGGEVVVQKSGSVTLLDFFATWCAPCKAQMPEFNEVREAFPDVYMISITTESDEAAIRRFWRKYNGNWPVAMDPELKATRKYDGRRMPTKLILDPEGEEVWRHVGLSASETIAEKLREAGA